MKISYNWLKEFLPNLAASPEEVAELLTMHAVETVIGGHIAIDPNITVVKIVKIEAHPNADRLRLATVTDGEGEITVVCGAPNIEVGQVVPYCPPGTVVKDADGNDFVIKEAKIRGITSPGMLNSLRELGLHREHGGIWILPPDLPLGTKLADHVLPDSILDVDVTPNRAHDLLSHRGVAQEVAALLKLDIPELAIAELPDPKVEISGFTVNIQSNEDVPRYVGAALTGVQNGISPLWMQMRLLASGTRPISTIVDITNYVMYEMGNPSHAFDAGKLSHKDIGVRRGKEGESIPLLDTSVVAASGNIPVITIGGTPVAVAGVMGGSGTEVEPTTSEIFLEVANFRPYLIQEASRLLNVRTEASTRFSKGFSPILAHEAAARLVQLFSDLCGAKIEGLLDTHPDDFLVPEVMFSPTRATQLSGVPVSPQQVKEVLERLRFRVKEGDTWRVSVPFDRLDISIEADVAEEVIRVMGLQTIESKALVATDAGVVPKHVYWREAIKDLLVTQGFTEAYNYSFESADMAQLLGSTDEDKVEVANPASPEQKYMRSSLLPGLLKNLATNKDDFHRKFSQQERALFEVGKVFIKGSGGRVPGVIEREYLAGVVVGNAPDVQKVVQEIENLAGTKISPESFVGALPNAVLAELKYRLSVFAFEFDIGKVITDAKDVSIPTRTLEEIEKDTRVAIPFTPYSRHPSVYRDISLSVAQDIVAKDIEVHIQNSGSGLVVETELFDEFTAENTDKKSLAFHIEFRADDRTLTDAEVDKIQEKIIATLQKELGAEIR